MGDKNMSINFRKVLSLVLAVIMLASCVATLASCSNNSQGGEGSSTNPSGASNNNNGDNGDNGDDGEGKKTNPIFTDGNYTYNTYTAQSPSNWNELTYQDNNDTQIMNYLESSFFT